MHIPSFTSHEINANPSSSSSASLADPRRIGVIWLGGHGMGGLEYNG